jgi:O-antigen ligase
MLQAAGIETRFQLAITVCLVLLIAVTTLGGSGGAPWTFLTYRSLLFLIATLGIIGSRYAETGICRGFLACTGLLLTLMLVSVLRIPGSHFDGFYLWFKYVLLAAAFLSLANYARAQSARWKGVVLGTIVLLNFAYLLPDLVQNSRLVAGFSKNNANYFATFLLIGLAISLAAAVYSRVPLWRAAAAISGAVILFGIVRTSSRGATLAATAMIGVAAIRSRGRIPRQVWLAAGLAGLLAAIVFSPYLIGKFLDRGNIDPYSYARTEIWKGSLRIIAQNPMLGIGLGQYFHISKRFTLPVEGLVARYMKRAQMAHNEYLQHMAEIGLPAAILLFALLGYLVYLVMKRASTASPEFQGFHEAALLTAAGVGTHALVDNCWTIPVTVSSLIVLALANPLPLRKKAETFSWRTPRVALVGATLGIFYFVSTVIPWLGLHYNDLGHKAYNREDYREAERYHLAALNVVPNNSLFLDNLGMVYLQQFTENGNPNLLTSAKEYFGRAIEASPQSLDPHVHMETVLVRTLSGEPSRDHHIYRELLDLDLALLQIDPFVPFPRKNLAIAYYNLGQFDHALLELKKAIEYEPNYVPGYLQMARWYSDHGDSVAGERYTAAAIGIINRYRDFKPTNPYEGVLLARPEESWSKRPRPTP